MDRYPHHLAIARHIHDFWGQWTGRTHRKYMPPDDDYADWNDVVVLKNAYKFYNAYNTDEVIAPSYLKPEIRERLVESQGAGHNLPVTIMDDPDDTAATDADTRTDLEKAYSGVIGTDFQLGPFANTAKATISHARKWLTEQGCAVAGGTGANTWMRKP